MRAITMNDRRSIGRTRIAKGALLSFSGHTGVRPCGVTDVTSAGAGIRTQDLAILPLNFELSFDDFRTIRKCRLIWRDGDFLGVAFENQNRRTRSGTTISEAGGAIPGPAFSALNDPLQFTKLGNADGLSENTSDLLDRKIQHQADFRFAFGVAAALALPVLIGMGVYIATTAILGAS